MGDKPEGDCNCKKLPFTVCWPENEELPRVHAPVELIKPELTPELENPKDPAPALYRPVSVNKTEGDDALPLPNEPVGITAVPVMIGETKVLFDKL